MKRILLLASILALTGCTDPQRAKDAVENMGLSVVSVGGYSFFGCSDDDHYATKFVAKRPDGKIVNGVVCSGFWGKGATVRFE